jgi:predicted RNA binding protein YcfA (HicA-like mRNA interferase family)
MSKHATTKERILSGISNANIDFDDLCHLLTNLGFTNRTKGSHRIFSKSGIREIINLQPARDGKCKPYQIRQVALIIKVYQL